MDIAKIKQKIDGGEIEYVKIGSPDIEGVFRGKRVAAKHFLNSLEDGFAQCDVLFGWDIAEKKPELRDKNQWLPYGRIGKRFFSAPHKDAILSDGGYAVQRQSHNFFNVSSNV